jgi:hypothetical protein
MAKKKPPGGGSLIFRFEEDHPEGLAFFSSRLSVAKEWALSENGQNQVKRHLIVIPFEDERAFGSQNAPTLFETALQEGERVSFRKNPVALAHV